MTEQINVGDTVTFIDQFGKEQISTVTRIVPKGEYSEYEEAYAIEGTYGTYVRVRDEIRKQ